MFGPCLILWDFAFEPRWATSLSTHSVRHDRDLGGGIYVTEFSARTRVANLDRLRDEAFDVLVVGGGIVGAGVARDAACRGLRTALVERGDFASGTSGKTSRLIHGGLRYLRSYRVGLVRQSVRERDLLLKRAPSLVHPLAFVIPAYRGRRPGALLLRFGLFLYDFLSRDKTVPRRVWLAADATVEREPRLSSDALAGAGIYFDAWTDDARLALTAPRDGRIVFVLPWNELALVGTTDTDYGGDADHVVPNAADVAYLLDVVNSAFPQARVTTDDVVSAYAGLRPLLRSRRADARESDISREHAIFEDNDGLISVAGGKLTTHRSMAEDVIDLVSARLERTTATPTKERPLGPPTHPLADFTTMGFDEASALHLQARFAPEQVRRYLEAPGARDRIVDDLPDVWVEVEVAIHEEMAMTLVDGLVRRLGLFYEARDQALGVADEGAERMAETLGWDASRGERGNRLYRERVAEHRKIREKPG